MFVSFGSEGHRVPLSLIRIDPSAHAPGASCHIDKIPAVISSPIIKGEAIKMGDSMMPNPQDQVPA